MTEDTQSIGRIAIPCAWLSCREPIVQELGRGRRKEYCSDTCRRAADRDYKRAKAHVDVYGEQLRKSQHEVAAYGRKAESGALTPEQLADIEAAARIALARASALIEVGLPAERAAEELTALVRAVTPLLAGHSAPKIRTA